MKKPKPAGYWTEERCIEEASKWPTITDWMNNSVTSYCVAIKFKIMDKCTKHMIKFRHQWSDDELMEDAKKYIYRSDWQKYSSAKHRAAQRKGIDFFNKCCAHMQKHPRLRKWTDRAIINSTIGFEDFSEWKNKCPIAYQMACKRHMLEEITSHLHRDRKPNNHWNYSSCKEEADKYENPSDWINASPSSYQAAAKNGWLYEFTKNMKRFGGTSNKEKELIKAITEKYPSLISNKFFNVNGYFKDRPYIHRFQLDGFIPELNLGIEFNGKYHHSFEGLKHGKYNWPDKAIRAYHLLKKEFFASRNIYYIEIDEKDWNENPQKCIDRCLEFLNLHKQLEVV